MPSTANATIDLDHGHPTGWRRYLYSTIHDELVQEFYGINPGTLKVDNVAITRSGKLSQWTDRGYQIHQLQGSDVLAEILALTGLIELVGLHPKTPNLKRHEILADLTRKR